MGIDKLWNWFTYVLCNRSKKEEVLDREDQRPGSIVQFRHHHFYQPAIKQRRVLLSGEGSYNIYIIDPCVEMIT